LIVRYVLRDLETFLKIMEHPGRGQSYSIRDLAATARVSKSKIERIARGELDWLDVNEAHRVVEALGVSVLVLFMPPASTSE
jgi:hypothetical protein